jgi:glycosyltransferase involved in cell wall biosynthesis
MTNADVSVVIPCFDAEATVERAVKSVLAQTLTPAEIIVVDDNSTDSSRAILAPFAEAGKIRLICLPSNTGPSGARNAGITAARSRYIAFLDADDEWLPQKLARQLPVIAAAEKMSMVGCKLETSGIDGSRRIVNEDRQPTIGRSAWKQMLEYSYFVPSGAVMRRSVLDALGGFDESLRIGEDQDLFIRAGLVGDIGFIDEVLAIKHEQQHGLSRSHRLREPYVILPLIERHCRSVSRALTWRERRRILGRRYGHIGRNVLADDWLLGLRLIARAIFSGTEPLRNLSAILVSLAHIALS